MANSLPNYTQSLKIGAQASRLTQGQAPQVPPCLMEAHHLLKAVIDGVLVGGAIWLREEILRPNGNMVIAGKICGDDMQSAEPGWTLAKKLQSRAWLRFFDQGCHMRLPSSVAQRLRKSRVRLAT